MARVYHKDIKKPVYQPYKPPRQMSVAEMRRRRQITIRLHQIFGCPGSASGQACPVCPQAVG